MFHRMVTIGQRLKNLVRQRGEVCALLTGFFLWYLTNLNGALSVDEVVYARTGQLLFRGDPYANPTHIFAPTARYFIGFGELVLGPTSVGARAPILVFGLLTIAVTYELGVLLDGRGTGFLAALVLGVTYPFARHSVMAMLDVPLAFFFIALLYMTVLWIDEPTSRRAILVGSFAAAVATTKAYGVLYAVAPVVAVVAVTVRRSALSDVLPELRHQIGGGIGALGVIYAPFVLIRHPPVDATVPPLSNVALQLPIVGNFVYIFRAALTTNLDHIGRGHAVEVGSMIYQYPPVWTYIYWLFEWGAIYAVALIVVLVPTVRNVARTQWGRELLVGGAILAPFLALSLLTVKFPRYVLPVLAPLLVLAITTLRRATDWLYTAIQKDESERFDAVVPAALLILVLGISLVPPSPVVASAQTPVQTDTGYDRVADVLEDCSVPSGETVVLSYHSGVLNYYLNDQNEMRIVPFTPINVEDNPEYDLYRSRLRTGQIHGVVTIESNPRLKKAQPRLYHYIRDEGERQVAVEQSRSGTLVFYTFDDITC